MTKTYNVAVLGLGTMGSLTCMGLARRKASVLGIDRFAPPHTFGSHTGETRVFRTAYAEHPDYVPLAQLAGRLWDQYGEEGGTVLLARCGQLNVGLPESALLKGIRLSASRYSIPIEMFDEDQIRRRYPMIAVPAGHIGILEPTAGWIDVNPAIRFGISEAKRAGADIVLDRAVLSWKLSPNGVTLLTGDGRFEAERLVVTAGAWAGGLLPNLPLTIQHRALVWVWPLVAEDFAPGRCPVFTFAERFFYGFPTLGEQGVKISLHWRPTEILRDPTDLPAPGAEDIDAVLEFAWRYLPGLAGPLPEARSRVLRAKNCLYTMTPDEHFIVDRHPESDCVYFAAGFSGHGFKFAPAIAVALTELALDGRTALPIEFLGQARFGR